MTADTPQKGEIRRDRYQRVLEQYKRAMESGFYLEAVTLMESIISDRLESRATYLGKTTGFDTLGKLCNILSSDTVLKDIIPQIVDWKNGRNRILHEMSKIDVSDMAEDFGEKYESGRLLAQSGLDIFRQVDAAVRRRQP